MKHGLSLSVLSLLGAGIVLLATSKYGAGLSPDSVGYIDAARNLAASGSLVDHIGNPMVYWPPLFPTVLATIQSLSGADPLSSTHVINAILFAFIVFLSGVLLFRHLNSHFVLAILGIISVLFSIPLLGVSRMAWSEPLFTVCVLLFLIWAKSYMEKGDLRSLGLLAAAVAVASLTRYIGVTLIISGAIIIAAFGKRDRRTKLIHLCAFLVLSSTLLGIWISRNYLVSGTLLGPRAPSQLTLVQNLSFTFYALLSWYLPHGILRYRPVLALLGIAVGSMVALGLRANWPRAKALLSNMTPFLTLIVVYTLTLVISATTTAYDWIDSRQLSPLYVPLTLLLLMLAERSASMLRARLSRRLTDAVLVTGFAAWLLYPVTTASLEIIKWVDEGAGGFNSTEWRESETIEFLQREPFETDPSFYSDAPDALYILADFEAGFGPVKTAYNSPQTVAEAQDLAGHWPQQEQVYLVWFHGIQREYLYTVEELQTLANIEPILQFADGTIYSISSKTID